MPKVLIIDDDELGARTAARALRTRGYEALITTSPIGFSRLLNEEKPDLVLVDVKMPALSGDSLVQIIKSQPDVHRCPLVLWSSKHPDELERLVKTSGADGYIHKSGGPDEFEENVRRFLGGVSG
jgi:DNA-binding response OmpR family regulator